MKALVIAAATALTTGSAAAHPGHGHHDTDAGPLHSLLDHGFAVIAVGAGLLLAFRLVKRMRG